MATPAPVEPGDVDSPSRPRIVAIYPNPTLAGDRGEFVVVEFPRPGGNRSLTDGETSVSVPANRSGRVALATDPAARNLTDTPVVLVTGQLRLSNGGEWVALVLHGEAAGRYYARVFGADWQGGRWRVPVGLPGAAAVLAVGGAGFARRSIEFESAAEQ